MEKGKSASQALARSFYAASRARRHRQVRVRARECQASFPTSPHAEPAAMDKGQRTKDKVQSAKQGLAQSFSLLRSREKNEKNRKTLSVTPFTLLA